MMMSRRLRRFALAIHLVVSVGWLGAVLAYLVLDLTTVTRQDAQILRSAYLGMDLIARTAIVPLAIASLITGLVMALGTKWGLFRHYWVLISLIMTAVATGVLLIEVQTIADHARFAADPATTADQLRAMQSTLVHSVGGSIVLVVVLVLNIYKPQGMTGYGWRRQQAERAGM